MLFKHKYKKYDPNVEVTFAATYESTYSQNTICIKR